MKRKFARDFLFCKQHYSSKSFKWILFMYIKIYVKNGGNAAAQWSGVHCMFITFINLNSKYVFMHNKIPRVNSRSFYGLSCSESTSDSKGEKVLQKKDGKMNFSNHNIFLHRKKLSWQIYYVSCIRCRPNWIHIEFYFLSLLE